MSDPRDEAHDDPHHAEGDPASPNEGVEADETSETDEPRVRVKEISVEEAVQMGIRHHRAGRLPEAEYIYGKVLEAIPDQPDALHFSGVVAHQLGRSEVAIERIQAAIAASPDHADMHNNLGRVLVELNRLGEARIAFERAIGLAPDAAADAWNNLGTVHKREGRWKEAGEAFQRAIQADPNHADAYQNLGNVLRRSGQHAESAACFRRAIELKPDAARDYQNLSQALWRAGQHEEARAAVREWLAYEPESPIARHLAAAFGIVETSSRASDDFVSQHFDDHADSFDEHLAELQYRAPEAVFTSLAEAVGWARGSVEPTFDCVLDAGCGTGLCGPLLAPMARRLVGVDLSSGMLEKARDRGYDDLAAAELTSFLEAHPGEYDAVVSADTLCYFGDLAAVTRAAFDALRPGGWFVFTVESLDALESEGAEGSTGTEPPKATGQEESSAAGARAPAPGGAAPAPGDGAPAPGDGAPATGDGVPAPGGRAPALGDGAPAPGDGAPAPGDGVPAPGDGAPAPGDGVPAAGDGAPGYQLLFHGRYAHGRMGLESSLAAADFAEIHIQPEVLRMEVGEPVHGWLARARRPSKARPQPAERPSL